MNTSARRFVMILVGTTSSATFALSSLAQQTQNYRINYDQYNTNTTQLNRPQIHPNFIQGSGSQNHSQSSGQSFNQSGSQNNNQSYNQGAQSGYQNNYQGNSQSNNPGNYQSNNNNNNNNQSNNPGNYQSNNNNNNNQSNSQNYGPKFNGRVAYAPAGMNIPIKLSTGISTVVAQAGDPIQATVSKDIQLGGDCIPAGSTISGQITDVTAAGRLGHSGHLGMKFNSIRTLDGASYPISAHLVGGLDKYHQNGEEGSDQFKGETGWTKLKDVGVRGAVGTAGGAALGTAVGGIAGGGHGAGRGAWSGAAIGAGLGVADSLLIRKGREINIKGGTAMEIELDSPLSIAGNGRGTY